MIERQRWRNLENVSRFALGPTLQHHTNTKVSAQEARLYGNCATRAPLHLPSRFMKVISIQFMGSCSCSCSNHGVLILLFIALQALVFVPHVSALTNRGLALRWHTENKLLFVKNMPRRLLLSEEAVVDALLKKQSLAPTPTAAPLDPNQSEKRRVPRGSDPIHNRC
ncbi:hypothetical protein NL676_003581 [Syzygium grande]|nr:hypothetical protein NL676_003581 [Syzygium grande]